MNKNTAEQVVWYALYTRHQHERIVAGSLMARGFEVFLPLYEVIRRWSDRRKKINLPLFPCYVFVSASLNRKADILATAGIYGFVSFAGHPAPITPSEIDNLRRMVRLASIEPHPFLRYGDWIRVKCGPLEGIEGFLLRRRGSARLVISVEMLQKSAAVEIDAALTEKIARTAVPREGGFSTGYAERFGATA